MESGQRDATSPNRAKLTGETHYRLIYNYSSRPRWRLDASGRNLRIAIRYQSIKWHTTHRIWLQELPATDGFWSNKLLLHEFDHVTISSDPRLATAFKRRLNETSVLHRKVDTSQIVNRRYVDKLVKQHVEDVFQEISDLVQVRYKELDRITDHGQRPLPKKEE